MAKAWTRYSTCQNLRSSRRANGRRNNLSNTKVAPSFPPSFMIRHIETNVFESRFPRIERSLDQFSNFFNRKCWPGERLFLCSTDCCENGNWFRDNIIELRRKIVINFDCRFLDLDLRVKLKNVWFWILRLNPCLGYFRFIGWLGRDKV